MANRYVTFSDRALSSKETKKLNRELSDVKAKKMFQVRLFAGWSAIAIIVGVVSYFYFKTTQEHYLLFGCVLIYILIGYWGYFGQSQALNKKRAGLNFVIKENKAKFIRVVSQKYIELPEHEDEGAHYLFQLSNDRILSFGGQDFYPNRYFPSDDFEVTLSTGPADDILMLEIYNYGKKIKPLMRIKGKEKWDLLASVNYLDPENFTIIDGRLEDLQQNVLGKK